MVEGLSQTGRPIAVVDLDGTLVNGNTLHIYILTALRRSGVGKRLRILGWLAARKLHFVSHRRMKFAILNLIEPDNALLDDFEARVRNRFNPAVTGLLDRLRADGYGILLASAAPDVYIRRIWEGDYVSTPVSDNPGRLECRGTSKLAAVRHSIAPDGYIAAVITDHIDDLPLLNACANESHTCANENHTPYAGNYLVNPDTRTLTALHAASIPFTLLQL